VQECSDERTRGAAGRESSQIFLLGRAPG
jgi:hypothetical protein